MADIKRFTGFIAPDGTTHDTIKKATDYTRNLKIKEALEAEFGDVTPGTHGDAVTHDDRNNFVIFPEDLPKFLFENKDKILAAYNQDVALRAPRKKKAPAPEVAAA